MSDDLRKKFKEIIEHPQFTGTLGASSTEPIQSSVLQPSVHSMQQMQQNPPEKKKNFPWLWIMMAILVGVLICFVMNQNNAQVINTQDLENSIDELLDEEDDDDSRFEEINVKTDTANPSIDDPLFQPLPSK